MLVRVPFLQKTLFGLSKRKISLSEAAQALKDFGAERDVSKLSDVELKKLYKRLALKYHPDVAGTGSNAKFQRLQQAYEKILLQRNEPQEKPRDQNTAESQPKKSEEELYREQEQIRQEFEVWRRSKFTQFDRERHDEFLKQRAQENQKRDTSSHFHHPNAERGPTFAPNKSHSVSQTSKTFKFQISEDNEEKIIALRRTAILLVGAAFNFWLYRYYQKRRDFKIQHINFERSQKVYLDKQAVVALGLSDDQVRQLIREQPDKYELSSHLQRKVFKN